MAGARELDARVRGKPILRNQRRLILDLRQSVIVSVRSQSEESKLLKVLLPVDGSPSAINATRKLIDTLDWYRELPAVELCTVHLPLPKVPNMGQFVSKEMVQKYYADESEAMLKPSRDLLDAAGITCTVHRLVGPIAETIVERARQSGVDMIYMGTRGMSALANMAMGSVTTRVLHLAHIPVVLIH